MGCLLVYYFIDYVFDGCKFNFYFEVDVVNLLLVYGESKLVGDLVIV